MKKKFNAVLLCASIILSSVSIVSAESLESTSLDNELNAVFTDIPSEEQIKTMEEGGYYKVYPTVKEITSDGYQRKYGAVTFTTCNVNNKYSFIGQCSAYNGTSSNGTLSYTQSKSATTNWNVSSTVSGKTEVSVPYLAKVEATVGVTVGTGTTTSASSTATYTMTVKPGKTGVIEAYHQSVNASGTIKYWDYTPSGTLVRSGNLSVSGNSIVKGNVYYNAYEK